MTHDAGMKPKEPMRLRHAANVKLPFSMEMPTFAVDKQESRTPNGLIIQLKV
jgi:hypothetical protein